MFVQLVMNLSGANKDENSLDSSIHLYMGGGSCDYRISFSTRFENNHTRSVDIIRHRFALLAYTPPAVAWCGTS